MYAAQIRFKHYNGSTQTATMTQDSTMSTRDQRQLKQRKDATKVGQMARDPRPGPWPVKTARYLGRPGPYFAGYERPGPVAGRAMGRCLGPRLVAGPVRWPAQPASGPAC
jgi:hypothetical protein